MCLQNSYQHLKDIKTNDDHKKLELPVHVILGVNDYTIIKTQERPISTNILLSKTSLHDYENLCSLDCLDIEEEDEKNNEFVYREFRK